MKTVFNKTDFTLCDVPVPKGYKQSQTHVGVAFHKGNYYLTTSPYPACAKPLWLSYLMAGIRKLSFGLLCKPFIPEQWENPCLYIGDTRDNCFPYHFSLLQSTPLMSAPEPYYGLPAYNSDPDLFIEDDTIHVLNRVVYRVTQGDNTHPYGYKVHLFHIHGQLDQLRFKYQGTDLVLETRRNMISPCIMKYKGKYIMTELETNAYNDGVSFEGLYVASSSSIDGFRSNLNWEPIEVESGEYLPWHISLFESDGHLYSIVSCVRKGEKKRCWQMLGVFSDDLKQLHIYQKPLTDYKSYRSSALVINGRFVLYNAVVHESIKGSKAVDGRDILMADTGFGFLLQSLKEADSQR